MESKEYKNHVVIKGEKWEIMDQGFDNRCEASEVRGDFKKKGYITRLYRSKRLDWWILRKKK